MILCRKSRVALGLLWLLAMALPARAMAQEARQIAGTVSDALGEPLMGVNVKVVGAKDATITNLDGRFSLSTAVADPTLEFTYIGFAPLRMAARGRAELVVVLKEDEKALGEVVVTALGIQRKEQSLTYATQRVGADELTRVQDANVANQLEGRVSGITVTANAGGAGGASKIVLRGDKSIMGNSQPLIVVDGVPMNNAIRGQLGVDGDYAFGVTRQSEGSDPLSMINPDDIESVNVLKGANAAALYGSQAASGVVMITTKRGREGRMDVRFSSNVTFDTPLLTPRIQNVYGAAANGEGLLSNTGWGPRIDSQAEARRMVSVNSGDNFEDPYQAALRNYARDDVRDFFRTGVTTNNSVSLSGGTERTNTYLSLSNAHARGMMPTNSYNRNTVSLRQGFTFWNRLKVDASFQFAQTVTRNRPGGGKTLNPLFHLYMTPRNIDMQYYRDNYALDEGQWLSNLQGCHREVVIPVEGGGVVAAYVPMTGLRASLQGPMQNWAYMSQDNNNPWWLLRQNPTKQREERIFATINAGLDIWDGLSFQFRFNFDQNRYNTDSRRYATTFHTSGMDDYGLYWQSDSRRTDLYADYLLSYNKQVADFSLSASAGWVGHTSRTTTKTTDIARATYIRRVNGLVQDLPTQVNYFDVSAGDQGVTSQTQGSNWDKAVLATAQVGWRDAVYVDASYRRDWWRPFRIFKKYGYADQDNFGYFGVGASAIVSSLATLPGWMDYLKGRVSYSEVGNSIPNIDFFKTTTNLHTGASQMAAYGAFSPKEERNRSLEVGAEMLFFKERLSLDLTYYRSTMNNLYMERSVGGTIIPVNSARVRNQGVEATVGYNMKIRPGLTWRTSYNVSYNDNKILRTAYNDLGQESVLEQHVGGAQVRYTEGGSIGDMYVSDYSRDADGRIRVKKSGKVSFDTDGAHLVYVGNMNSKWQMGWSNTFSYRDFQLFFLIAGRIGGKVISLTEQYLDKWGLSQRTADARLAAQAQGLLAPQGDGTQPGMLLPDGSGRVVPVQAYYESIGAGVSPREYIYDATNFRLRELSLGYTFRDLFGANKNLSLSLIARNLFFIYNASPTDPDVSLSTGNGLGGFELFNMPSSRSYGLSLKANF